MLRPSHRIANRAGLLRAGSRGKRLRRFEEDILRNAAIAFNHFRRVARKVPLQDLKYASRIFQRNVPLKISYFLGLAAPIFPVPASKVRMSRSFLAVLARCAAIEPGRWVIFFILRVPPREKAVQ